MKKETKSNEQQNAIALNRKTNWEKVFLPNKDSIKKLAENGASERQIAAELHISMNCWMETKKKHPEVDEWISEPRAILVGKFNGALV